MTESTVYAIASGKGGVGKTTLTINLGAALAARGRTTVIVDADLGMANMATFLGLESSAPNLHDVLAGSIQIHEAAAEIEDGFAVIPGGNSLEAFAEADTEVLESVIDELREAFDIVLIDVGAGLSHDTVLPIGLADEIILVATPDLAAIENAEKSKQLAERMGKQILGIVLTRTGSQFDLDVNTVGRELEVLVLAVIPEDEAVHESLDARTPVVNLRPTAPAAIGFAGLARYLDGEDIQIPIKPKASEREEIAVDAGPSAPAEANGDSSDDKQEEAPPTEADETETKRKGLLARLLDKF